MVARKEGRAYCDPIALTYQAERMPEPIRLKVGQSPGSSVYQDFARNIPGFKPLTPQEVAAITPKVTAASAAASQVAAQVSSAANAAATAAGEGGVVQPASAAAASSAATAGGPVMGGPLSDECINWLNKVLEQVLDYFRTFIRCAPTFFILASSRVFNEHSFIFILFH